MHTATQAHAVHTYFVYPFHPGKEPYETSPFERRGRWGWRLHVVPTLSLRKQQSWNSVPDPLFPLRARSFLGLHGD